MISLVDNPQGSDIALWISRDDDYDWIIVQGAMFAAAAREAASAYVRGVGFEDPEKVPATLWHVIVMRAVRLAQNYNQVISEGADSVQTLYGAAGQGFTAQEQDALDTYRVISA